MTGIVDWAAARARMVIAFIVLALVAGGYSYVNLPKEGEPDIEVPAVVISLPFPGISSEDSEKLLIKPMETELSDLDGLKSMSSTAAEGYANVVLEFEFGWDKTATLADVRDAMSAAEAQFPAGFERYSISEFNFSEFPIIIVNLTGPVPERTLLQVAKRLQDRLEGLEPVLDASLAGQRDEMVEVVIDPLRLEAYNVTAGELIGVVVNNNQLIAAGEIETATGAFSVKIPASFNDQRDIFTLPVKVDGDRVVTLGDLADIRLTFEDRQGTARFNGENTVALQVVKRKGFNLIDTAALVRETVEAERAAWPAELQSAITVGTSNDRSREVVSMVQQLEGSVLTAIALVMIVVLAALGTRSALLVGFAVPTSFLMTFALFAVMDVTISNIVMFGLILAVGMLVDAAVVIVEYGDRRIGEGAGPMTAYTEAAKRMFWPVAASTATTLCAFLPMLFWPGVAGEFMGMLPTTMIFVLTASFIVAIVFLPVVGGVAGRASRHLGRVAGGLKRVLPWWARAALVPVAMYGMFLGAMQALNPGYLLPDDATGAGPRMFGVALFFLSAAASSITLQAARIERTAGQIQAGYRRTPFGHFIRLLTANPIMPVLTIVAVAAFVVGTFSVYSRNNNGVEFFVESEPEQAIVYVRARGNLSLDEKDALVRQVEDVILDTQGVQSAFAFAGSGGLNQNTGGSGGPRDAIGQVQIELVPWEDRPDYARGLDGVTAADLDGDLVLARLQDRLDQIPGIQTEILNLAQGPASSKPVHLRLMGDDGAALAQAVAIARAKFESTPGLVDLEDTLPLPGIDWQINVDVEKAGRYGADVATVGGMVQLVTRGILLDTMRVPSSEDEIEIRVRLPEDDRVLSTLDTLKVRTSDGLVPLSNFITREPVAKLAQIDRIDQSRYLDVKAGVEADLVTLVDDQGRVVAALTDEALAADPALSDRVASGALNRVPLTANERIAHLTEWLEAERPFPTGVTWEWTGDQEDQAESQAFLGTAFAGALGLMFIILLAQFNSFYNSVLVLLAVVLSTAGVLIGMLVMDQTFSIIMTGTGIVALAGIVVNNNIVLIDTYQEFSRYMPRIEAIIRTVEQRIRPVLLTTITTMAGLTPMMLGISFDFLGGGYSIDSPTSLWWKQLATAVVFGLGIATVLTLIVTPAMLALRVWVGAGAYRSIAGLRALTHGSGSKTARDLALHKAARKVKDPEIVWEIDGPSPAPAPVPVSVPPTDAPAEDAPGKPLRAAE
ncbi:efflux RND transporter permease subunit [Palleronia sp. KMU-117]|uniref:efflux RND transporter permease subunit n=1 Tax=Palleronia sp. KMU-117 TaxID=3434108 RepID=UPI003D74E0BA